MEYNNTNNEMFYPSTEWMKEKYGIFNKELFDGKLGDCDFGFITTGRGSQGGRLGEFRLQGKSLKANRYTRRMFKVQNNIYGYTENIDINKDNFYQICQPIIKLNSHYKATEEAWENTLVHEMCHYYTYMNGICPKQGHGPEFRSIASYVSSNSNGRFTIQRLATAEEMKSFKLDDDMQEKRDKRLANKKSRARAIFVFKTDGKVELTMVSNTNDDVVRQIYKYYKEPKRESSVLRMVMSQDPKLIEEIYQSGYRKIMRTWRFWYVEQKPLAKNIDNYEYETYIDNINESSRQMNKKVINEEYIEETIKQIINELVDNINNDNEIDIAGIDLGAISPFEFVENN